MSFLKILAVALALALDVFAVSVGVGIRTIPRHLKIRIGIAFASAEVTMVVIGAALGMAADRLLGGVAGYIGFVALVGLGAYMIVESRREAELAVPVDFSRGWGLLLASLSISLDSLGIGFSILYVGVPLIESLVTIAFVSVCATSLGLLLGRALGRRIEERAELWSGILLAATGIAFVLLRALHIG